jgi:hypothetical protein
VRFDLKGILSLIEPIILALVSFDELEMIRCNFFHRVREFFVLCKDTRGEWLAEVSRLEQF